MNDLQVENLSLYKPESSFANIFPDFPKTIKLLYVFKNFRAVIFKVRQQLLSDCFLLFTRFLPLTKMYCTMKAILHEFISKAFIFSN